MDQIICRQKKVKAFLVSLAEQANIGMENLASKKQINQFLSWHYKLNGADLASVDLMNGWRKEIVSEQLNQFAQNNFK